MLYICMYIILSMYVYEYIILMFILYICMYAVFVNDRIFFGISFFKCVISMPSHKAVDGNTDAYSNYVIKFFS